jgi:hypothetical protein
MLYTVHVFLYGGPIVSGVGSLAFEMQSSGPYHQEGNASSALGVGR